MADLSQNRRREVGVDPGVRDAVRSAAAFAAAGLVFLVMAGMWVGTCTGATADPLACGAPQRAMLALGAPAILVAGAAWSFLRGLRAGRGAAAWLAWLVCGWALLALSALTVVTR